MNPGIRFEHSCVDPLEGSRSGPLCTLPDVRGDAQPAELERCVARFGLAWDVQGDGKTAVKFGAGKYVQAMTTGFTETYDRTSTTRHANLERPRRRRLRRLGLQLRRRRAHLGRLRTRAEPEPQLRIKSSRNPAEGLPRQYQFELNGQVQRELMPGTSVTSATSAAITTISTGLTTCWCRMRTTRRTSCRSTPERADGDDLQPQPRQSSGWWTASTPCRTTIACSPATTSRFNSRVKGLNVFGGVTFGRQIVNTCQVQDLNSCASAHGRTTTSRTRRSSSCRQLQPALARAGERFVPELPGRARNTSYDGNIAAVDPSLRENWVVNNTTFRALTGVALTQSQSPSRSTNRARSSWSGRTSSTSASSARSRCAASRSKRSRRLQRAEHRRVLTENQTFGSALGRPTSILQGRLWRLACRRVVTA